MAKRTKTGRPPRAAGNRHRRRVKRAVQARKAVARRTVGAVRIKTPHASRSGKHAIERARTRIAKTARKSKSPKPKLIIGGTRKLPKIFRAKPRKKTCTTKTATARGRPKSVLGRVKAALRRMKSRKHFVIKRKRRHPTQPFPTGSKTRATKARALTARRKRPHASMRFFSGAKTVRADVSRRTASVIGSYLTSVRRLLETHDIEPLEEFAGRSIKDVRGNAFPLETRPNVLYRLDAAVEPFEEVYRLLT